MPGKLILLSCFSLLFGSLLAQKPATNDEEYEKSYKWRTQREVLYGVYIPKDLTECFIQLNRLSKEESKNKFRQLPEEDIPTRAFFGLGRWIIHNWGFYGGSRLTVFMNNLGLFHPDDMAVFIMTAYHRNLNKNKLEVKELLTTIKANREAIEQKEKSGGTIIHQETRKRPKPEEGQ
ncbi:MAG: DUF6794 domain-containing protein [Bacteroidota bacterium]